MATVAEIIHQREAEIMKLWADEVRAAASARGLSAIALENVMPLYLSALADQLETGHVDANDLRRKRLQSHLSTRVRQGFELAEILYEFAAIGQCIAKVWRTLPEDQQPSATEVERLHTQIHVAITEVTETFQRHMLEDEQSEKRYLRRLQIVASEALHDIERPLRDRFRDLLDIVMEAMGAQCAAFLVYNVSESKLVLAACAGAEALEPYATSLDPKSYVGQVAAHEEPTEVADAVSTTLEVPEPLRQSGIHSLLGMRLPPEDGLLGVMYVGISEERAFTPREVAMIEALGERLSLHLENARLFDELHDKLEALDIEKALRERFVSMLAHDLRGPLSAARLCADLLAMQTSNPDESRELGMKIVHNIERVDRMIHDLLDANRIRAGEPLPLRLEECDLVAMAEQVVEEARQIHGDRFIVESDGPVRGIWSQEELHRAIWNLVTNAVKYGASKQPITIALMQHGDVAGVSVHNTGTPIPAAEQARIFDAYARAPAADASGRIGWGLGLTLVRGTAEAHGGHVSLTSDRESGTTFTIELPLDASAVSRHADDRPAPTVH
ncbi:MAG TPA: GAF domain-containing sensor histidine kinase [Kofleriaceae bacterium]|nr:GAF domain-containing sensor histidine kinase [Kofleriaceae bacterium]